MTILSFNEELFLTLINLLNATGVKYSINWRLKKLPESV